MYTKQSFDIDQFLIELMKPPVYHNFIIVAVSIDIYVACMMWAIARMCAYWLTDWLDWLEYTRRKHTTKSMNTFFSQRCCWLANIIVIWYIRINICLRLLFLCLLSHVTVYSYTVFDRIKSMFSFENRTHIVFEGEKPTIYMCTKFSRCAGNMIYYLRSFVIYLRIIHIRFYTIFFRWKKSVFISVIMTSYWEVANVFELWYMEFSNRFAI